MKMKLVVMSFLFFGFAHSLLAQKKVALLTFYCDKKIQGVGLGLIENLINDPNFSLQPLVNKSYKRFVEEFAKDFPFELIDHQIVSSNEQYKGYKSKMLVDTAKTANKLLGIQYAVVDGFIFAYGGPKGLLRDENWDPYNLSKMFADVDGILFVSMDYEFESRLMGFGAGIKANLNMYLYNKQTEKVFKILEYSKSKGKVGAVAGVPVMNPKEIQPLCEDATEVLFEELKGKLGKIVKKSAKNL